MVTPAVAWPYSLAKRLKAFAIWEGGDPGRMIARGGRIAADAGNRIGAGVVQFAIDPALQNYEQCFCLINLVYQAGEVSYTPWSANLVQVETYDSAGQTSDMSFVVTVWEPLITEKVNDWTPA